jgi:deaminated glutathione amidase
MDAGSRRDRLRLALVQMNAGPTMQDNLCILATRLDEAAAQGAELVALPENAALMVQGRAHIMQGAFAQESHPGVQALRAMAARHGLWLLVGSLACLLPDGGAANRSFVMRPDGSLAGFYDKIHMFDADLPGGESYHESATFRPGTQAAIIETPWGGLGLSICYDVRFPQLYRALAQAGARMIAVPAAFTVPTGQAHWHALLRARAIETGCFVLAPAQTGVHEGGRSTYGHSLVVGPWGQVILDAGETAGIYLTDLDLAEVERVRAMLPSLAHDRPFSLSRFSQ